MTEGHTERLEAALDGKYRIEREDRQRRRSMKARVLGALIGLVLCVATATDGQISDHPSVVSNTGLVEAWLGAQMAYRGLPGVSVAIVHDQELVYTRGFGYADVEARTPASPSTIYRIASHSKLFTAISIMQLRDTGELSLDDPISEHLLWFNIQNPYADTLPVTIRHLLTHTSGLPREAGSGYWVDDFDFPSLGEVRERLVGQAMVYPPATRWKYSNLAWALAGEIVATVSGQTFDQYVEEHILDPLGMQSTSVVLPDEHQDRMAVGYGRRMPDGSRARFPFVDAVGMAAAAGVSSTVEDMARFISWQFRLRERGGSEVLEATTLHEMQRVQWLEPDWDQAWGLGFQIFHTEDRNLIGHGGGYPGYLTATHISPSENVGVVVFTNALDAEPSLGSLRSISQRIFEWVAPAISRAAAGEAVEPPDPSWDRLTGSYRSHWGDVHVLPLDGKLVMIDPVSVDPKAGAFTLVPVSGDTFRLEGGGGHPGGRGELVTFETGLDGMAESVTVGYLRYDRVTYSPSN